jgi:hypothetical protein
MHCTEHRSPQRYSFCDAGFDDYCESAYAEIVSGNGDDLSACTFVELGGES